MSLKRPQTEGDKMDQILAEIQRDRERKARTYRERALKIFPHICGRCGREFVGKRLRELTVHHKDHNHENNPPDGSNWELLCLYCHDMEHQRYLEEDENDGAAAGGEREVFSGYRPFAGLDALLRNKK